jgi:hypothetical protein
MMAVMVVIMMIMTMVVMVVVVMMMMTMLLIIIIIIISSSSSSSSSKDTISFMQGIYTYIPETNHVPKQYNVAAILSLLFMMPISLAPPLVLMYFYISTFRSMCAVPNMAVLTILKWFLSLLLLLVSP